MAERCTSGRNPVESRSRRCRGFTIAEMVVASFLTALLAVLMAAAAVTFARPAAEVDGRTRLALEASLAAEALARDLSGYLADNSDNPGNLTKYQLSPYPPNVPNVPYFSTSSDYTTLFLYYQESSSLFLLVTYQQQKYGLVRTLSYAGSTFQSAISPPISSVVVASHVTDFNASLCNSDGTLNPDTGTFVKIEITLTYPDPPSNRLPSFSATYVLIGVQPPPLPT